MDIERELEILIDKHKGKQVGVGEIRLDRFAEDCLKEIRRLKSAIARQSETKIAVCPDCNGSGVYQEYDDEFDRYHVYACYKCEGTGEIARQSVTNEEVAEAIEFMKKEVKMLENWIDRTGDCFDKNLAMFKTILTALQAYQPEPPKGE